MTRSPGTSSPDSDLAATRPFAVTRPIETLEPPEAVEPTLPPDIPEDRIPPPPVAAAPVTGRRRWRRAIIVGKSIAAWVVALGILAAAAGIAWWIVEPQLEKPYVYDEAAFAFAGHAVAQTGVPLSNVGHMQTETPGDFSQRFNWALWHPPLYVFSLGYAFRLWGESERTARLLGVSLNGAAGLLIFAATTVLLAPRRSPSAGPAIAAPVYGAIAAALYVTNPFVVQSALLLDIDGTVLVASITLLAFVYILLLSVHRPLRHPVTSLLIGLGTLAFGLTLWAKMTTSFALLAAATACRLIATRPWRPWRVLVELPVIALGGAGLFLGTWWAACQIVGMPVHLPFKILWTELHDATGSTSAWRENPAAVLEMVSHVALWTSPYLLLLFAWAGLSRVYDLVVGPFVALGRKLRKLPPRGEPWGAWSIDFVLAAGGAIGLAYLIKLAASFPKYHITMMPFVAIGVGYLLYRYVPRLSWWEPPIYGVVLAGMAGYFVTFVGDQHVLFRGYDFVFSLLVWPAALGFAFLVLGAALGRHHLPRQLAILGVLLTLSWSWGVHLAQRQADYSTAYNYGTNGQKETAAYLDSILRPDQPYVASRDVAYYTTNKLYVDQDTWWEHLARLDRAGITIFDGSIAGYSSIEVLALFLWDPTLGAIAHSYLARDYVVTFQAGPFVVFQRWRES